MCAAIACGAKENDRPRGVGASADASGIEVSWQAVPGATGVAAALAPSEPPAGHTGLRMADERAPALHAPQEEIVETAVPSERVVLADLTSFCVVPGMDVSPHVRKPATRLLSTAHADFFDDDEDAAHYDAAFIAGWAARSRSVCCPRASPPSARPPTWTATASCWCCSNTSWARTSTAAGSSATSGTATWPGTAGTLRGVAPRARSISRGPPTRGSLTK
jgi:hypothetical protein